MRELSQILRQDTRVCLLHTSDSVSIFRSLGFRLLKPGLVASNRYPYPTCGAGPEEGNEVHPKPSVPVQRDLSGTTCQLGPLTTILLA